MRNWFWRILKWFLSSFASMFEWLRGKGIFNYYANEWGNAGKPASSTSLIAFWTFEDFDGVRQEEKEEAETMSVMHHHRQTLSSQQFRNANFRPQPPNFSPISSLEKFFMFALPLQQLPTPHKQLCGAHCLGKTSQRNQTIDE